MFSVGEGLKANELKTVVVVRHSLPYCIDFIYICNNH